MRGTGRIVLVLVVASVVAYFFLHSLRSFNVTAEWRGLWAGAAAALAAGFAAGGTPTRRRRRR